MSGYYIYDNGAFQTVSGAFTVPDKQCVELSIIGLDTDQTIAIYEEFGMPCDNISVPATHCCTPLALSESCPKLLICEAGKYWVDVSGLGPDAVPGADPATFPANIKVFAKNIDDVGKKAGGGCGCG